MSGRREVLVGRARGSRHHLRWIRTVGLVVSSGLGLASIVLVPAQPATAQPLVETRRASVRSDGGQVDLPSGTSALSADGRTVAFSSRAEYDEADTNGLVDVVVRDLVSGRVTLGSVAVDGGPADGASWDPRLSGDGTLVMFRSDASNLVSGDTNNLTDVFVRNIPAGVTTRVSESSAGGQTNDRSWPTAMSDDGSVVLFGSSADDLIGGDTNGASDLFVRSLATGAVQRVSVGDGGQQGNGHAQAGALSADGRVVAFSSLASNLVPGDTNNTSDVFVRDLDSGTTRRVSVSGTGAQTGSGFEPSISDDGRYVAYSGEKPPGTGYASPSRDVMVHDRMTGATTRVSEASDDLPNEPSSHRHYDGPSFGAAISGDGQVVVFGSYATNLLDVPDTNGHFDVFRHVRATHTTTRVSVATDGTEANGESGVGQVSGDGSLIVFDSSASNLVPDDTNGVGDVFIRDLSPGTATPPTVSCGPADAIWHADNATVSCATQLAADPADDSFELSTSVPDGTETASANTDSRSVCNPSGCTTAGPVGPFKIDRAPPTITISGPADGSEHPTHTALVATWECADAGSGVASCTGTVDGQPASSGDSLPSTPGTHQITVTAVDATGNTSTRTFGWTTIEADDGFWVVFANNQNGNWDLYAIRPDGSGLKNLTNTSSVDETYPRVAPDGGRMAFVVSGSIQIAPLYDLGDRTTLVAGTQPAWSHDGRRIAYTGPAQPSRIYVVDADGTGAPAPVTPADGAPRRDPSFSPDGVYLVYSRLLANGTPYEIAIRRTDASDTEQPITAGVRPTFDPTAVTPYRVVYNRNDFIDGQIEWNLYLIELNATPARRITSGRDFKLRSAVSPDGLKALFESQTVEGSASRLVTIHLDGTNRTSLYTTGSSIQPEWTDSPCLTSTCSPPAANAGPDQAVSSGANFTLNANGSSDPSGGPLDYKWTQLEGPPAVIRDEDEAETTVEGVPGPATLHFRVTVTNPRGLTDSDEVIITIRTAPK